MSLSSGRTRWDRLLGGDEVKGFGRLAGWDLWTEMEGLGIIRHS